MRSLGSKVRYGSYHMDFKINFKQLYTGKRRESAKCLSSSRPRERAFFCSQAKADNFRTMKYIAKIKIVVRSVLTVFQNHFTASGSPVDFVLPTFSLFPG